MKHEIESSFIIMVTWLIMLTTYSVTIIILSRFLEITKQGIIINVIAFTIYLAMTIIWFVKYIKAKRELNYAFNFTKAAICYPEWLYALKFYAKRSKLLKRKAIKTIGYDTYYNYFRDYCTPKEAIEEDLNQLI